MVNQYAEILKQIPVPLRESPSLTELREFCNGITGFIQPKGHCELEPGYIVNYGQQFRITLVRSDNQYQLTLLRAYVPLKDFPVLLDTYDEEMIKCESLEDLQSELSIFLRQPYVQTQIQEWMR